MGIASSVDSAYPRGLQTLTDTEPRQTPITDSVVPRWIRRGLEAPSSSSTPAPLSHLQPRDGPWGLESSPFWAAELLLGGLGGSFKPLVLLRAPEGSPRVSRLEPHPRSVVWV